MNGFASVQAAFEAPPGEAPLATCPDCDGAGEIEECPGNRGYGCSHSNHQVWTCSTCRGRGEATTGEIAEAHARECPCGTPVSEITNRDLHRRCNEIGSASVVAVLLVCIFGALLFLALLTGGRHAMCATHDQALSYCPGHQVVQVR